MLNNSKKGVLKQWRTYSGLLAWLHRHPTTVRRHPELRAFWAAHGEPYMKALRMKRVRKRALRKLTAEEKEVLNV